MRAVERNAGSNGYAAAGVWTHIEPAVTVGLRRCRYLEHIFRYAASTLFGTTVDGELQYKQGRNADMRETVLKVRPRATVCLLDAAQERLSDVL